MEGDLVCSHALIDLSVQMYDDNVVKYLDWRVCTSRLEELAGAKFVKALRVDSGGYMKERTREETLYTNMSSDLRLRSALTLVAWLFNKVPS